MRDEAGDAGGREDLGGEGREGDLPDFLGDVRERGCGRRGCPGVVR